MIPLEVPDRDLTTARFVRARRRNAGLTQQELADLASVGKRFIVELEDGKQTVRLDKVNQVLRAFGKRLGPIDVAKDAL
jgi:y4mF family transcriptional regulator